MIWNPLKYWYSVSSFSNHCSNYPNEITVRRQREFNYRRSIIPTWKTENCKILTTAWYWYSEIVEIFQSISTTLLRILLEKYKCVYVEMWTFLISFLCMSFTRSGPDGILKYPFYWRKKIWGEILTKSNVFQNTLQADLYA